MTDEDLKNAVVAELEKLPPDAQRSVLDYARSLLSGRPRGMRGAEYVRRYAGMLTEEEARQMLDDISEAEHYAPSPKGRPGRDLMEFAGMLTHEEAEKMRRDIEEVCERMPEDA